MNKKHSSENYGRNPGATARSGIALFAMLLGCLLVYSMPAVMAQSSKPVTVSGKVTDHSDGTPIVGASIYVKGTSIGAITDPSGVYKINIPSTQRNPVIVFSYLGYTTIEESWDGKKLEVDMQLRPAAQLMDEVVVVGYGTQAKSDITGAISSISRARLEEIPTASTAQLLQGAVAGLNFSTNSSSSDPDNDNIMLVRGRGSVSADNAPLIVVDGVPFNGTLSDISPGDIENFNVLKDASAVAIYGSRAANGVFIITTKQGKKGRPTVRYETYYTVSDVANFPRMFSVEEYATYKNLQKNNPSDFDIDDPSTWSLTDYERETLNMIRSGEYDYKSWRSLILRNGSSQRHTLSVNGGSDNSNYNISAYYLKTKGVVEGDDYQKANFRANVTTRISKAFKFNFGATFNYTDKSGETPSFQDAFNKSPLFRPLNPDGSINISPGGENDLKVINPLENLLYDDMDRTYGGSLSPNLTFNVPWVKGLTYKLNTSIQFSFNDKGNYMPSTTKAGGGRNGVAEVSSLLKYSTLVENIVNYDRTFNKKHKIAVTVMQGIEQKKVKTNGLNAHGFESDAFSWYGASSASYQKAFNPYTASKGSKASDSSGSLDSTESTASSSSLKNDFFAELNMISYMFRATYVFDERFPITYTARYDGSSVFGQDKKWGLFQAVSAAWNISNEKFFSDFRRIVNDLRLRVSFGENGNQAIKPYQSMAILGNTNPLITGAGNTGSADYVNNGIAAPGLTVVQLGNPELTWETTQGYNIGVDFGLLNSRINGDINLYRNFTRNLLLLRSVSSVHGVTKMYDNVGKTLNEGIEISINSLNISRKDFSWSTSFTYTYNRNKILDLYGDGSSDVDNKWFLDHPIRSNYDYLITGTWQLNQKELAAIYGAVPGYAKYDDYNGDGMYTSDGDKQIIGTPEPTITASLNNTFRYKNWSLSVLLYGVLGTTKSNAYYNNTWYIYRDYWTESNPTNKFWSVDSNANAYADGKNSKPLRYENADYMRVKNITLGYEFDKRLLVRTGFISGASLYVSVNNPWTVTNFGGLDPELGDGRNIPLYRELTFGAKLTF